MKWIVRIVCFVIATVVYIPVEHALASVDTGFFITALMTIFIYLLIFLVPSNALIAMWEKRNHSSTYSNRINTPSVLSSKFNLHLNNCCNILKNSSITFSRDNELDIYAIAYVISDYAVCAANKNRRLASDEILSSVLPKLSSLYSCSPTEEFRRRVDFYGEVIRGIDLHAHCLPGVDISDANPVLCCAIAFTDCLLVPTYISDYSGSPTPNLSALEVFEVSTEVLQPLLEELVSLHNEIFTHAK